MAQQASPYVNGKTECDRAQLKMRSAVVVMTLGCWKCSSLG